MAAMKGNANAMDIGFYRLVHQLMGDSLRQRKLERRGRRRYRFWASQWIAPWDGGELPAEDAFFEVQCYDLTRGGFSFLLPELPQFPSLVVAFGKSPRWIFIGSEVAHCSEVLLHASGLIEKIEDCSPTRTAQPLGGQSAKRMTLVGCRFVRRLESHRKAMR
jgi:hypothetical protein